MTERAASDPRAAVEPRNLVICLDGTTNEPETGFTNVARLFDVCVKDDTQLVYYDPGVGTMGSRAAVTQIGRAATRFGGMVAGYGIRDNIEEAYGWLCTRYRPGDQIYVFGFSRGAYTARALTGMLRTVGLLHPDALNLVPYALKLYTTRGPEDVPAAPDEPKPAAVQEYWRLRNDFRTKFGNPDFPVPFRRTKQVRFLGVWDTVKSVGWLNLRARVEIARWPFTANIDNVETARHALALDERRRPFAEYRFAGEKLDRRDVQEMWFAGVHGDIGGSCRPDSRLPDVALSWMVDEAHAAGIRINRKAYRRNLDIGFGTPLPDDRVLGPIVGNNAVWRLARGWRDREVRHDDLIHPSVAHRVQHTAGDAKPYRAPVRSAEAGR
ncbi:DUF2235 domain-containing protein [Gordonia desulfuricans]|uniref:DUF2235 domain-containing protein n=1 Tax=Gordonia desulfuricans TaxID=89051 RepID=A0A7K3LTJ1_9ACTN|nr:MULTISPECIES: DUF2235 domain-containing protein [Gordonia]EMP14238.2 hypothetical protein ISGA_574 [Gordonia sp. NB41Y]NDK91594.1 DUF2235 domain-containing protein [Gordonia desulfuricans]WLP88715.1 DUF2235 domain-containing protein [Gordonia sp. NB41Y]